MFRDASVTVIIPARNEEASLPYVLTAMPGYVDRVIVADNGSEDHTADVARSHGAMVCTEAEKGYGAACLCALRYCEDPDIVVFMDADGSDDPVRMDVLLTPIVNGTYDFVLSDRTNAPVEPGAMSRAQIAGNMVSVGLIRLLWGVWFHDLAPFRAIAYDKLRLLGMQDRNFGWTVEMQLRAVMHGLRIREIPLAYGRREHGHSHVSARASTIIKAGATILFTIVRLRICAVTKERS
jgi:glycosyltransferase involved in cell wall biosynthesis